MSGDVIVLERMDPDAVKRRLEAQTGTLLVCAYDDDERTGEFLVPEAIPLLDLEERRTRLEADQEIIFYCGCPKDETAQARAREWRSSGFARAKILQGGHEAWTTAREEARRAATAPGAPAEKREETRRAKDVMTPHPGVISSQASVTEAAWKMRELDVGVLPVCDESGRFVGMLTDRDITVRVTAEGKNPDVTTVGDAMTKDFVACDEEADVTEVARVMQQHQVRRVPIVKKSDPDRNRPTQIIGIISLGDLATDLRVSDVPKETLKKVSEAPAPVEGAPAHKPVIHTP